MFVYRKALKWSNLSRRLHSLQVLEEMDLKMVHWGRGVWAASVTQLHDLLKQRNALVWEHCRCTHNLSVHKGGCSHIPGDTYRELYQGDPVRRCQRVWSIRADHSQWETLASEAGAHWLRIPGVHGGDAALSHFESTRWCSSTVGRKIIAITGSDSGRLQGAP